jgi:hypothetical protein
MDANSTADFDPSKPPTQCGNACGPFLALFVRALVLWYFLHKLSLNHAPFPVEGRRSQLQPFWLRPAHQPNRVDDNTSTAMHG